MFINPYALGHTILHTLSSRDTWPGMCNLLLLFLISSLNKLLLYPCWALSASILHSFTLLLYKMLLVLTHSAYILGHCSYHHYNQTISDEAHSGHLLKLQVCGLCFFILSLQFILTFIKHYSSLNRKADVLICYWSTFWITIMKEYEDNDKSTLISFHPYLSLDVVCPT